MFSFDFSLFWFLLLLSISAFRLEFIHHVFFHISLIWFFYCLYPFSAFRFDFIHRVFFHISLIWFFTASFHFRLSLGGHSSCILSHFLILFFYCYFPFSAFLFEFIHHVFFHISLIWFLLLLSIFRLPLGVHSSCILSHFTHFVFTASIHFPPSALTSFIVYSFTFHSFRFYCFFPFSGFRFDFIHHVFFDFSLIWFLLLLSIFRLPLGVHSSCIL
ncbi:unnamed protein product [Acanthosepion pharaonis]|uniref:Uncharacterized protein n=1 Tax=Acanthosepion pharaonis TaxID=158019 RepID=A0A812B5G5_ACAPH|nr:unnamed protein product [Sepia pharaonis]